MKSFCFVTLIIALTLLPGSVNGWWWKKKVSGRTIAMTAEKYIDNTKWSYASKHTTGANTNKCNIFVADVLREAGADVPQRHWWRWSPIGAGEWGNPNSTYLTDDNCYKLVSTPQIGDIIGDGKHVGIMTAPGYTTSANSQQVVKKTWGFPSSSRSAVWRYVC